MEFPSSGNALHDTLAKARDARTNLPGRVTHPEAMAEAIDSGRAAAALKSLIAISNAAAAA